MINQQGDIFTHGVRKLVKKQGILKAFLNNY